MGRIIGAKGYLSAQVPMFLFLLLQTSTLVWAEVDIYFYESLNACSNSPGVTCTAVYSDTCCEASALYGGSVLVSATSGSDCLQSQFYRGGNCTTLVATTNGANYCVYGQTGDFTGAQWSATCRRRSLLSGLNSNEPAACTKRVSPNAVIFTEDGTKGNWILDGDVTELYLRLKAGHEDGDVLAWLQAQGATYKAISSI